MIKSGSFHPGANFQVKSRVKAKLDDCFDRLGRALTADSGRNEDLGSCPMRPDYRAISANLLPIPM